jgi:hypothetical protein
LNYYFECAKIVIYHAFENKKVFRILAAMQAQFFLLFLFISGTYSSMAQGIRGRITNAKGEPLPYVTIYSPTAKAGANSNVNGAFELKLPKGTHQINFQSIDYKTQSVQTEIGANWTEKNIVLEEQVYELNEVKIRVTKENPANYIMRKAIGAAPYYRRQVLKYKARVYVKGTGKVDAVPRLLRGLVKEQGIEVGKAYVTESINELQFTQPNTYREKVISLQSTMPFKDAPAPMRMARGSWYAVANSEVVSPLSPEAFGVYKFVLEGSFYENGKEVNKIRVEPKRKGNDLYRGTIYILEGLWCLHSLNLSRSEMGMETTIKTSFKELPNYPFVWMPVTYDIKAVGDYFGVMGEFRYLASVSNYQIQLNPNVDHQWAIKQQGAPKEVSDQSEKMAVNMALNKVAPKTKNQLAIDALLAKEQLKKSEMLQLASRMKRESEQQMQEMSSVNDSTEIVVDSMAMRQDTSFWNQNRTVPLMEDEQKSFHDLDTLRLAQTDSLRPKRKNTLSFGELIFDGDSFVRKGRYFSFEGPLKGIAINTVEGVTLEAQYSFGSLNYKPWRFTQIIRAPLERMRFQSEVQLSYGFNPMRFGELKLRGGSMITDYNPYGISTWVDAYQLLIMRTNFSKFYQQDFAEASYNRELFNGFQIQLQALYTNRYLIENIGRYQKFEGTNFISNNTPVEGLNIASSQESMQGSVLLQYRPFQTFVVVKNKKRYLQNSWPNFTFLYKEGYTNSSKLFSKIEFGLNQNIQLRHWLNLSYLYKLSTFPMAKIETHFADYTQFAANQSIWYLGAPLARFQQLPYYSYSALHPNSSLFLQLSFKKLLLRQLPYFNLLDFNEQLYFNLLSAHGNMPLFYESGYRVNNVMNRLSLGVNFHFIENKFKGSMFVLSVRI